MTKSIAAATAPLDVAAQWRHCFTGAMNVLAVNYDLAISQLSKLLDEYFPFQKERTEAVKNYEDCPDAYYWTDDFESSLWSMSSDDGPIPMTGFIFGDALCWRGRAYLAKKQFDQALADFKEAVRHLSELVITSRSEDSFFGCVDAPSSDFAYLWPNYWIGRCHIEQQQFKDAIQVFDYVRTEPIDWVIETLQCFGSWMCREECFFWEGVAFEALGQKKDAIESYSEAIWINPNNCKAFFRRGRLGGQIWQDKLHELNLQRFACIAMKDCKEDVDAELECLEEDEKQAMVGIGTAVKDIVEAIWLNPRFLSSYIEFFRLLISNKVIVSQFFQPHHLFWANEFGEPIRFLVEAAAKATGEDLESLELCFSNPFNFCPWQGYNDILSELANRQSNSAAWFFLLGIGQYKQKGYDAAKESFEMAIACDPSNGVARYGLAATYRAMHNYTKEEQAATAANRLRTEMCEHRWRLKQGGNCEGGIEFRAMPRYEEPFQLERSTFISAADLTSGEEHPPVISVSPSNSFQIYSLAFSRSEKYLAVGYGHGEAVILETDTGTTIGCIASRLGSASDGRFFK